MILLALLLSAAPCAAVVERRYVRLADLPKAAAQAIDMPMAEKGAPFQATDVVGRPALPSARFVRAVQRGCAIRIAYEQGGIAHRWLDMRLVDDGSGWRRETRR